MLTIVSFLIYTRTDLALSCTIEPQFVYIWPAILDFLESEFKKRIRVKSLTLTI